MDGREGVRELKRRNKESSQHNTVIHFFFSLSIVIMCFDISSVLPNMCHLLLSNSIFLSFYFLARFFVKHIKISYLLEN
jgi:hypothetical protein